MFTQAGTLHNYSNISSQYITSPMFTLHRPVYNGSQVSLRSIYDQEKEENVEQKGSRKNSR